MNPTMIMAVMMIAGTTMVPMIIINPFP
jgi:hypothetical protein